MGLLRYCVFDTFYVSSPDATCDGNADGWVEQACKVSEKTTLPGRTSDPKAAT